MKATVRILDENGKAKALLEVSDSWKFIKEDTDNSSFVMMVDPETVTHLDVVDAVTPAWKLGDAGSSRDDRDTEDSLIKKEIKPEDIPASGAYEGFAGYHVTAVSGVGKNGPFRYPIVKFQTDFYDGDCLLGIRRRSRRHVAEQLLTRRAEEVRTVSMYSRRLVATARRKVRRDF